MAPPGSDDPDDDTFVLLLEDLDAAGCELSAGPRGVRTDEAAGALEALAHLHARFEDPDRRAADVPWARTPGTGSDYGAVRLRYGLDHHRDRLSDRFAAIALTYIDQRPALQELWTGGPATVIHGDAHIGNVLFDRGTVGFLDWGIVHVGSPLREVSYFLNMAMDVEERRRDQEALLRLYLTARADLGAAPITFDEAWTAHRRHAAYCVVASCQVVTFPEDATPARRVHADAFLARAEAAIDDLDAVGALVDAGLDVR
jgi:hypothetical protein